jgi:hypothetical protein
MSFRGREFSTADNYTQIENTLSIRDNQGNEDIQRKISTKINSPDESASRMIEMSDELTLNTLYDPKRSDSL